MKMDGRILKIMVLKFMFSVRSSKEPSYDSGLSTDL